MRDTNEKYDFEGIWNDLFTDLQRGMFVMVCHFELINELTILKLESDESDLISAS